MHAYVSGCGPHQCAQNINKVFSQLSVDPLRVALEAQPSSQTHPSVIQPLITYRKMLVVLPLLTLLTLLLPPTPCLQYTSSAISFPRSNILTRSFDTNTLYTVGLSTYRVYRLNYTRNIAPTSMTSYASGHTKLVNSIAVSRGQKYVATGGSDFRIYVTQTYTQTRLCTFMGLNQIKALVFHPLHEEILYSASMNDMIRKWNITTCSKLAEKNVSASVSALDMALDGTQVYYGTFEGHVGMIDENLLTYSQRSNAHRFTVLYIFTLFGSNYVSIGEDSRMVLWNAGTMVANFSSITSSLIVNCLPVGRHDNMNSYRLICCFSDSYVLSTYKVTAASIDSFTTHGVNSAHSPMNWIDMRSMGEDEQVWTYHYGSNFVVHKIKDDNGTTCSDHLANDLTNKVCRLCGFFMPGCHFCSDSTTCTTCGVGLYRSGNQCLRCSAACSSCSSATSCSTCAVGYYSLGSNCQAQNPLLPGCYQYRNSGNRCDVAANGYYIDTNNMVFPCSNFNAGCMQCTRGSSPSCLACYTGFYISGSTCVACSATMSGCQACENSTVCLKCPIAFKIVSGNQQCSPCDYTCATCGYYYNQCLSCPASSNRILTYSTCPCQPGYLDIANTATCPPCNNTLTFCFNCLNTSYCTQCQTNYYLYTSGSIRQCQTCSATCQTCSITSTNCTSCNAVHNRQLASNNCNCVSGYVSVNGSIPCTSCGVISKGCLTCSNWTYCTGCDTGYYLNTTATGIRVCAACPYYCPDCSLNASSLLVCNSCPAGTNRQLSSNNCTCQSGYFDDNQTLTCMACSSILTNCLTCTNRTKCLSCSPGMLTDAASTICTTCMATCQTCGTYYDVCTSCVPASGRVLIANRCVCPATQYQVNNVCISCGGSVPGCDTCQLPGLCTGCLTGYLLSTDLTKCIHCSTLINGCLQCQSSKQCTLCNTSANFTLINGRCRCPVDRYTSDGDWGRCVEYKIDGVRSALGVELQVYQHWNNSVIVYVRFRAQQLYIDGNVEQSINMTTNGIRYAIVINSVWNNQIKLSTEISSQLYLPNITLTFAPNVFYSQSQQTLATHTYSLKPTRLYHYSQQTISQYNMASRVLYYTFYALRWAFFVITLIGQGHVLFPFIVMICTLPVFLTMRMCLPGVLVLVLEAMLGVEIGSVVPIVAVQSDFYVLFPPMVYGYYGMRGFLLFDKTGDLLLLVMMNLFTKFDEGIVRMFPQGKIRRYLYQSLVRRGYAAMSLSILALQPSMLLLAGAYLSYPQFQSPAQIFNYCSCVAAFGFYLAYNFNHASNLHGSKQMRNIENQQCFLNLNQYEPTAQRTTLIVLVVDFWLVGAVSLVTPMVYFVSSLGLLVLRLAVHCKRNLYAGPVQFALRVASNLLMLGIYAVMFVLYLGEEKIALTTGVCGVLGLGAAGLIMGWFCLQIGEKVVYHMKMEADYLEGKVVEDENGEQVIFDRPKENQTEIEDEDDRERNPGMRSYFNNTQSGQTKNNFSSLAFRNRPLTIKDKDQSADQKISAFNESRGYFDNFRQTRSKIKSEAYFHDNPRDDVSQTKTARMKAVNTSRYAKNHLELRYKAQEMLQRQPDQY